MPEGRERGQGTRAIVATLALLAVVAGSSGEVVAQPLDLSTDDFVEAAPQGFTDPNNTGVWSMAWWNGHLYVGTVQSFYCFVRVWANRTFSIVPYPPNDPDVACPADPKNLAVQAEIWRYTPATQTWKRVYQAPKDVPIPGQPGKFTSPDLGYRAMAVFTEPDGSEALYVGGVTTRLLWGDVPPPRILRSTDGETFAPVPQDPGTLLGNPPGPASFRSMTVHQGRLYVVNGPIQGQGFLLEAENPAGGNDNFRQVSPPDMNVYSVRSFNGFLYVGVADSLRGYAVLKVNTTAAPPYRFIPVVSHAGFLTRNPKLSALGMQVHNGRLYVGTTGGRGVPVMDVTQGTFGPCEMIRINPDDSWDLVVGTPRSTPTGFKEPISGLGPGFDWFFTTHVWSMEHHEGSLYIGTLDSSVEFKRRESNVEKMGFQFGAELFRTVDGYHVTPITSDGFGDMFQMGIREIQSSPHGLFVGSFNYWKGLRVWQGIPSAPALDPVTRLEVEERYTKPRVLSWDPLPGATRFRVFRAILGPASGAHTFARPPREIGTSTTTVFFDKTAVPNEPYHYFVIGEASSGAKSAPSNVVRAPLLASQPTFRGLAATILDWGGTVAVPLADQMETAGDLFGQGQDEPALNELDDVETMATTVLPPWRVEDLHVLLEKLRRRIGLVQAGILAAKTVVGVSPAATGSRAVAAPSFSTMPSGQSVTSILDSIAAEALRSRLPAPGR